LKQKPLAGGGQAQAKKPVGVLTRPHRGLPVIGEGKGKGHLSGCQTKGTEGTKGSQVTKVKKPRQEVETHNNEVGQSKKKKKKPWCQNGKKTVVPNLKATQKLPALNL